MGRFFVGNFIEKFMRKISKTIFTTKETAKVLGVCGQRVRQLIGKGQLLATAIPHAGQHGREWLISKDELENFKGREDKKTKNQNNDK